MRVGGPPQCHVFPQEIAGLIKGLSIINHWFPLVRPYYGLGGGGLGGVPLDCHDRDFKPPSSFFLSCMYQIIT